MAGCHGKPPVVGGDAGPVSRGLSFKFGTLPSFLHIEMILPSVELFIFSSSCTVLRLFSAHLPTFIDSAYFNHKKMPINAWMSNWSKCMNKIKLNEWVKCPENSNFSRLWGFLEKLFLVLTKPLNRVFYFHFILIIAVSLTYCRVGKTIPGGCWGFLAAVILFHVANRSSPTFLF